MLKNLVKIFFGISVVFLLLTITSGSVSATSEHQSCTTYADDCDNGLYCKCAPDSDLGGGVCATAAENGTCEKFSSCTCKDGPGQPPPKNGFTCPGMDS